MVLSLALFAVAGISEASDRREGPSRTDVQCTGAPTLPEAFVAPNAAPPGPLPAGALLASAEGIEHPVADAATPSKVDRRVFLIDAQVLEKYLAFRESLTSP